ncbi:hypothetical protein [Flavobacterium anhuiense]|uniref:hypothetical protein n=1 Tax=Flavobacterium anhuiense TaxID=459526 RepID=UPI000E6CE4E8|nr:hypothetical protein [Flavobacterium anhuiense]
MELSNVSRLKDHRTDCFSVIIEMTVADYLGLVNKIYLKKGGIKGQREPLKSSSAMRIRKQMVKDIKSGTILPPVVLGLIVSDENFELIPKIDFKGLTDILNASEEGNLTIIDGMQRTTALNEAIEEGMSGDQLLRVEFWISTKLNSLVYRMLILNTGQVPWNLRRQIETVFSTMINEIKLSVPKMEIYTIDDPNRRTKGGQYHANDLIELYLAFGGRKEKVDTKERLADEFTRLDFIEATENLTFSEIFYSSLNRLTQIDVEISKYQSTNNEYRFSNGIELFKSQPARVGFITAIAKFIYGRPGVERSQSEIDILKNKVFERLDTIVEKLADFNNEELGAFLSLNLLSEKLSVKSSRVGDFEREFFTKSFEVLIDEAESIHSMDVCWLSY